VIDISLTQNGHEIYESFEKEEKEAETGNQTPVGSGQYES